MYHRRLLEAVAEANGIDPQTPWRDLPKAHQNLLLEGTGNDRHTVSYKNRFGRKRTYTVRFEGMLHSLERRYENTDSEIVQGRVEELMALQPCPKCHGARLRPESLAVTVGGLNIHEYTTKSARAALEWIQELEMTETERAIARLVVREIGERLRFLDSVGIGYLSLERGATSLSGGEAQRIRLATQIGSSLVGVLYILDEPSIGLHQRDNEKLIGTLERLRDLGNTVIVVEHDEGTMRAADHVIDLGPGAGEHGGEVVAEGTPADVQSTPGSATGEFLSGERSIPVPDERRRARGKLKVRGAAPAQPQGHRRRVPARHLHLRHRGLGLRKVNPGERDPLPGSRQPPASGPDAAWRAQAHRRARGRRQDHQHRPVPDRPDSTVQPGDVHGRLRSHPQALLADARGTGPRLQARALLASTSRAGAARSAGATARSRSRCTSCPTSTCRASSATGAATTARRSRSASRASRSPTCSRCPSPRRSSSSRRSRRSTGACRRSTTSGSTTSASASRPRRSRAARRSASSSRPSWPRSPPGTPSTSSTSRRRDCTSPTSSACSASSAGSSTPATPCS